MKELIDLRTVRRCRAVYTLTAKLAQKRKLTQGCMCVQGGRLRVSMNLPPSQKKGFYQNIIPVLIICISAS